MSSELVTARQALPGRRYYTAKNVLLQAVRGDDGKLLVIKNREGEFAAFNRVSEDGTVDPKRHLVFTGYSQLRPAFERRPGRPRHADKTWTGWAQKYSELPNALVKLLSGAGLYRNDRSNYMLFGLDGQTHFVLFRSGHLGVRDDEAVKCLKSSGFDFEVRADKFYPRRISLSAVSTAGRSVDLLSAVESLMPQIS